MSERPLRWVSPRIMWDSRAHWMQLSARGRREVSIIGQSGRVEGKSTTAACAILAKRHNHPPQLDLKGRRYRPIGGGASVFMTFEDGIEDDTGRFGPVHLNLGLNPMAQINEHPESERVRGAVTLSFGNSGIMVRMYSRQPIETVTSPVHWDVVVMRARQSPMR